MASETDGSATRLPSDPQRRPGTESSLLDPKGNFTLYVSNQSFAIDPVDIRVFVDNQTVVEQDFYVKNQHNWKEFRLSLAVGSHTIRAKSTKGSAQLEETFDVKGKHWAVMDFWYYPPTHGNPTPRHFSLDVSDKPVYFE